MNHRNDFFEGYSYGRDVGHKEAALVALIVLIVIAAVITSIYFWSSP